MVKTRPNCLFISLRQCQSITSLYQCPLALSLHIHLGYNNLDQEWGKTFKEERMSRRERKKEQEEKVRKKEERQKSKKMKGQFCLFNFFILFLNLWCNHLPTDLTGTKHSGLGWVDFADTRKKYIYAWCPKSKTSKFCCRVSICQSMKPTKHAACIAFLL